MNETMASERPLARPRGRHSARGNITSPRQIVIRWPPLALLDARQLARIHCEPDVLLHPEHLLRTGGDAEAEGARGRSHDVVPVLAEVCPLHDLSGNQTHAVARRRWLPVQVDALGAKGERHARRERGGLLEARAWNRKVVEGEVVAAHVGV